MAMDPNIVGDDLPSLGDQTTEAVADLDMMEEEPEEDINSKRVTLADLCAKGAALYAHKNYEEAAECYAKAAEQQADINGEMSPENSEILFLYGRSLFKVGQSKSDVLGGKAAGDKKKANGASKQPKNAEASSSAAAENPAEGITEEGVAIIAGQKEGQKKDDEKLEEKKPLFQFTGDENWDDSDGEVR
jgi:HAT1-interacting factor 1